MGAVTKTRVLNGYSADLVSTLNGAASSSAHHVVTGRQVTVSESHPSFFIVRKLLREMEADYWLPDRAARLKSLRDLDIGGDFYTSKQAARLDSPYVNQDYTTSFGARITTQGRFRPFSVPISVDWKTAGTWPNMLSMRDETDLCRSLGTTAIARTAPTVPVFSLANFLGELRNDGIPTIIGTTLAKARGFKKLAKAGSEEYLNYEFGWAPFVSDLIGLAKTVLKSEKILREYEERSGQNIGRKYSFPPEVSTQVIDQGLVTPSPSLYSYAYGPSGSQGRQTLTKKIVRTSWFEGTYSYYVPLASDARSAIRRHASEAEKLLGLKPTPEVLWNLAPWTWLSDWFLNVGSIMTNISAFSKDGLILRRGYIMTRYEHEWTFSNTGVNLNGYGPTGAISETFTSSSKTRRRASPYGFGVTFSGFSPRQIAILGALGVSRST